MTPRVTSHGDTTEVADVTIGIGFHWERRQTQRFAGTVELHPLPDGRTRVVNRVDTEEYLRSVISSEMNATSSAELLKAHAVISRSWLFAQLRLTRCLTFPGTPTSESRECAGEEIIKWYDRDDHTDFDVCADDHCQRYQGVTRASTPQVDIAVSETAGMVLATADGVSLRHAFLEMLRRSDRNVRELLGITPSSISDRSGRHRHADTHPPRPAHGRGRGKVDKVGPRGMSLQHVGLPCAFASAQ